MNILCFIVYDNSSHYCFCEKYYATDKKYNRGRHCCVLFHTQIKFVFNMLYVNNTFLRKYLQERIPFLTECFVVNKKSIEVFYFGKYEYSGRQ